jgi:hypothetical protein
MRYNSPWRCANCTPPIGHGRVSPTSILLKPPGVELLPSRLYLDEPQRETDVRGWGAVLYEMLTGSKPQVDGPFGVPRMSVGSRGGPSAVRPAVQRLAMKCLALPPHMLPTMQQALSEVRLLAFLAKQYDSREKTSEIQTPPLHPAPAPPVRIAAPSAVPPRLLGTTPPASPLSRTPARTTQPHTEVPPDDPTGTGYALKSFGQPRPKKPPEPAPKGSGPCPRCDAVVVYVSRPRSAFENLMARCSIPICRCHRCYHRWIVVARVRIGKSMPPAGGTRKKRVKNRKSKKRKSPATPEI